MQKGANISKRPRRPKRSQRTNRAKKTKLSNRAKNKCKQMSNTCQKQTEKKQAGYIKKDRENISNSYILIIITKQKKHKIKLGERAKT